MASVFSYARMSNMWSYITLIFKEFTQLERGCTIIPVMHTDLKAATFPSFEGVMPKFCKKGCCVETSVKLWENVSLDADGGGRQLENDNKYITYGLCVLRGYSSVDYSSVTWSFRFALYCQVSYLIFLVPSPTRSLVCVSCSESLLCLCWVSVSLVDIGFARRS